MIHMRLSSRLCDQYLSCCLTSHHIHYSEQIFQFLMSWKLMMQYLVYVPLHDVGWTTHLM